MSDRLPYLRAELSWLMIVLEHLKANQLDQAMMMVEDEIESTKDQIDTETAKAKAKISAMLELIANSENLRKKFKNLDLLPD